MRRRHRSILRGAAVTFVAAAALGASGPDRQPGFDGTWEATTDVPPDLPAAPGPVLGARFALRLEADRLTVIRPARDRLVAATFALDGSPTRVVVPGRMCEGDGAFVETAVRDAGGLTLTVVASIPAGGGPGRTLSAARRLRLVDANTVVVEGSIVQAGQSRTVGTVYRRGDALPEPDAPVALPGAARATIADVAWISGSWRSTTDGVTTEEHWLTPASGAILGTARTLRGDVAVSYEFLCIVERDGGLVYTALPDGRTTPTHFTLTAVGPDSAHFANPAHDYPTWVRYARTADGALVTTIGGDGDQRQRSTTLTRRE